MSYCNWVNPDSFAVMIKNNNVTKIKFEYKEVNFKTIK